jgi:hypothetical protein
MKFLNSHNKIISIPQGRRKANKKKHTNNPNLRPNNNNKARINIKRITKIIIDNHHILKIQIRKTNEPIHPYHYDVYLKKALLIILFIFNIS